MNTVIRPIGKLIGEAVIPGDKSISHRGIMFGSLAKGTTRLTNFLKGDDCFSTINAFRSMGIDIEIEENEDNTNGTVIVHGKGLRGLKVPADIIDVGNSGTTARLLAGILAGQSFASVVDGDQSLRNRPMGRIIEPLTRMGARIQATEKGTLPISIEGGKLRGMEYKMPVASAQVKSAIILATLYSDSPTVIYQPAQSRDHTEIMLKFFGGRIKEEGTILTAYPAEDLYGQEMRIPGDISSAAYLITAALLVPGSRVVLKGVGINQTRTGIIDVYKQMGARITIENTDLTKGEPTGDIIVEHSNLHGVNVGGNIIPRLIDEIPIIALAATQAQGTTIIKDAAELKVKESNRIDMVVNTLRSLGANIEATDDGMAVHGPSRLSGNRVSCNMDHRIALMAAIAGLIASGETRISDGQWINISFPGFFDLIQKLRA